MLNMNRVCKELLEKCPPLWMSDELCGCVVTTSNIIGNFAHYM